MNLFVANDIVKRFSSHTALENVSISVLQGKIFGLLGPNGAGKTTLIRIINRITAPDSGELWFNGRPMDSKDISRIGYLPEERGLYKKMNVKEHIVYLARLKGLSKKEALIRVEEWFHRFGIENWANKKVQELSKGMQQKVQFISTVLHSPELLIFDEPFSGFDPINAQILKKEILRMKQGGATIIFSTHNMESVEELCDYIVLIDSSKTLLEGEISTIKENFKTNTYFIRVKGDSERAKNILSTEGVLLTESQSGNVHEFKVRFHQNVNSNSILRNLISESDVSAFHEEFPSMHDIFIKIVTEKYN